MPVSLREPLIASALENRSPEEIASRTGLSVPAVKSRLGRARQELTNRLEKHQGRMGPATLTL
ncbi:MAG: RNA polymerase sigma factor [Bryobacteraceae bacterium]